MANRKYDQEFMKTPEGLCLYNKWRRIGQLGRCPEWDDLNVFLEWALANGFENGASLKKYHIGEVYGPDNAYFHIGNSPDNHVGPEWCDLWNKTVNRIRAYYGMEPVEGIAKAVE